MRAAVEPAIERRLPPEERGCFHYAFEDLDGDGRDEILAYVKTFGACGTGGCPLYVLTWNGRRLVRVSRLEMIRNVFVDPRSGPGWRPLLIEKWGMTLRRVRPLARGYPRTVDKRTSSLLSAFPPEAREVSWIEAECCASEEGIPDGLGPRHRP